MSDEAVIELNIPWNFMIPRINYIYKDNCGAYKYSCEVYLDERKFDDFVWDLAGPDTKSFKVPSGQHSLMITSWWQTETIEFYLNANEKKRFEYDVPISFYFLTALIYALIIFSLIFVFLTRNIEYSWLTFGIAVSYALILRRPGWVYRLKKIEC